MPDEIPLRTCLDCKFANWDGDIGLCSAPLPSPLTPMHYRLRITRQWPYEYCATWKAKKEGVSA